jgi:hypothetical protein
LPVPEQRTSITHDLLIASEGAADESLFRHLCSHHAINDYQFLNFGGLGNLETWLLGLTGFSRFSRLRLLMVVADSDDHPLDRFKEVRKALKKVKLPAPDNAFQIKREANKPSTMIVLLPFTLPSTANQGCLETVLLPSASAHLAQHVHCMDQFSMCVQSNSWPLRSHVDKLKLRVLLSGSYQDDPYIGVQYALDPAKNLIPLNHPSLDPVVTLLRQTIAQM